MTQQTKKTEEIRIVLKEFSFALTTDDFATKGKEVGQLHQELAKATSVFESHKQAFKAAEARIKEGIAQRIEAITTKHEMRTVECEQIHDFAHGRVFWRMGSTVLGERPMEPQERQLALVPAKKEEKAETTAPATPALAEAAQAADKAVAQ